MKMIRFALVAVMLASLAGCYKHTIRYGTGGNTAGAPKQSKMELFFIAGLAGGSDVDVKSICPSGNATVRVQHSLLDGVIAMCTSSLVTPTTVEVWCGEGGSAEQLSPEQVERLLAASDLEERLVAEIESQAAY